MLFDNKRIDKMLIAMQSDLTSYLEEAQITSPMMVGIHSGGVLVARRLHESMEIDTGSHQLGSHGFTPYTRSPFLLPHASPAFFLSVVNNTGRASFPHTPREGRKPIIPG